MVPQRLRDRDGGDQQIRSRGPMPSQDATGGSSANVASPRPASTPRRPRSSPPRPTPRPKSSRRPPGPAGAAAGTPRRCGGAARIARAAPKTATPQSIPPRRGPSSATVRQCNWGWVLAIVVILLALAAIAILGTVLLTRGTKHDGVAGRPGARSTIQSFDVAVQTGDLTTLRGITCGTTRDGYVDYDEHAWQRDLPAGRGGQTVSGDRQHRPGRRQRSARRGKHHHVHGLRPADPLDPQPRPTVPRRSVEDLPVPQRLAGARVAREQGQGCRATFRRSAGRCRPRSPARSSTASAFLR